METCWCNNDDGTSSIYASCSRSLPKTHCEPRVLQTHGRESAWMDECNLSFQFSAVPRQCPVEWTGCRRNRQERRYAHKSDADTIYEIDLVTAQDMDLNFFETFSSALVLFRDVPAECIARVVGNALVRKDHHKSHRAHWHFNKISRHRVAGCLTLTRNKKDSISSGVLIPFYKHFTEKSLKKICFSVKEKIRK